MSRTPVTVSSGPKIHWPSETSQSDGDPIVTAAVIGLAVDVRDVGRERLGGEELRVVEAEGLADDHPGDATAESLEDLAAGRARGAGQPGDRGDHQPYRGLPPIGPPGPGRGGVHCHAGTRAWRYGVHGNAEGLTLQRKRSGHAVDGALGRGVGNERREAVDPSAAGAVDNPPAPLGCQVGPGRLRHVEVAGGVDSPAALKLVQL
jgi:hypothetical protein